MIVATMPTSLLAGATLDDLSKVEGKAELISGRIVRIMPSGVLHNRITKRILRSLDDFVEANGIGEAFGDALGYGFEEELPSGRQSFCPDLSYYAGELPENEQGFIHGPPTFAVEVRSENDYGRAAEAEMASKRADYFAAGTIVVWDVDPIAETVAKYTAYSPEVPVVFTRGQIADAEPALPGWSLNLDKLFALR